MSAIERGSREWLIAAPAKIMSVADWQGSLERHFCVDGIIGPSLLPVYEAEQRYGPLVDQKTRGHLHLREGFQSFLYESIRLGDNGRREQGAGAPEWHGVLLLEFASIFRVFRAADVVFHAGYPLDAVSLLRDVRDRGLFLASVARKECSLRDLEGLSDGGKSGDSGDDSLKVSRKQREKIEREILKRSIGENSGLPDPIVQELSGWSALFHFEVHGSRLSRAAEFREFYANGAPLALEPEWRELPMSMFTNRFSEVAWIIHRCLPLLQLRSKQFDEDWQARWKAMDDAIREDVASLWRMGKPISGAITYLVEEKLDFSPVNCYRE